MLREWLAVGLGGMVGTVARHGVNLAFRTWHPSYMPWATLFVNVIGCLAIGLLFRWTVDRQLENQWWEVGIRVGILGGLTTFSSFALEVVNAWQTRPLVAIAIIASHVLLGSLCVLVGMQWAGTWR